MLESEEEGAGAAGAERIRQLEDELWRSERRREVAEENAARLSEELQVGPDTSFSCPCAALLYNVAHAAHPPHTLRCSCALPRPSPRP